MKNANAKRKTVRYRGTSTVEAAFVLIILLLITLGVMGFGWLFLRVQQVTTAARHGARIAIRAGSVPTDVVQGVDALLDNVNLEHDAPVIQYPEGSSNTGDPVRVLVTGNGLDLLNLGGANMLFIPIPDSYTASVTMAKEGP